MQEKRINASLLIIDVQNDFCPGGRLQVAQGDMVVPVINKIAGRFLNVVATQDWHPRNHVSFASNHEKKTPFDSVIVNGIERVLWPDHCIQGTDGADLHPGLDQRNIDLILRKGTRPGLDSYSAFFENDKKTATGLSSYLKGLGIEKVFVCGLAADICVYYSAMDSVKLGFTTFFVADASRGVDIPEGNIEKTEREMEHAGINIINSAEILCL